MTISDGAQVTIVEYSTKYNFRDLSETIPATLDCLEDNFGSMISQVYPRLAWLGHTESLSAWTDVLIFVNPKLGEQLIVSKFLIKSTVLEILSILERSKRCDPELVPLTTSVLAWMSDQCGLCKDKGLELLRIICDSLRTQIQIILTGFEKIAEGRDLPPTSLEDTFICIMTESPVLRTMLPSQYQHRKRDQSVTQYLYFRRSRKQNLRAICLSRIEDTGVDHCDSCLCAFVFYGVPDFALRLFGFKDLDSLEWTNFVLTTDWSFAFGTQCFLRPRNDESLRLTHFDVIFRGMLRVAFRTLRELLQKEELCLSIEELMLDWKHWRPRIFFVICRATARVFGSQDENHPVFEESFLECCREVKDLVVICVVMRKIATRLPELEKEFPPG
jgi:hypothetical protein